jgi:hypothetical protein
VKETQAEAASDSSLLSVSGYFRTNQIKAAACSFGLLRPCSNRTLFVTSPSAPPVSCAMPAVSVEHEHV